MASYLDKTGLTTYHNEIKKIIPTINNTLTSSSTTQALSANQGRVLNGKIPTVNNTLTSTSTSQALSAYQGKILNDKIPEIIEATDADDALTKSKNNPTKLYYWST